MKLKTSPNHANQLEFGLISSAGRDKPLTLTQGRKRHKHGGTDRETTIFGQFRTGHSCLRSSPVVSADSFNIAKVSTVGNPVFALGFSELINSEPDLTFCGNLGCREVLSAVRTLGLDALVIDLTEPSLLRYVKEVVMHFPDVPILVHSLRGSNPFIERAIRAKAKGYVEKENSLQEFPNAIREVLQGRLALPADVKDKLLREGIFGKEQHGDPIEALYDQQLVVFYYLGCGWGSSRIAEELELSIKTIESHRAHIKETLKLQTAPELVRAAVHWVHSLQ